MVAGHDWLKKRDRDARLSSNNFRNGGPPFDGETSCENRYVWVHVQGNKGNLTFALKPCCTAVPLRAARHPGRGKIKHMDSGGGGRIVGGGKSRTPTVALHECAGALGAYRAPLRH